MAASEINAYFNGRNPCLPLLPRLDTHTAKYGLVHVHSERSTNELKAKTHGFIDYDWRISLGLVKVQHHFRWNWFAAFLQDVLIGNQMESSGLWSELAALSIASVGSQCTGLFDLKKIHATIADCSRAHKLSQSLRVAKSISNISIYYRYYSNISIRRPFWELPSRNQQIPSCTEVSQDEFVAAKPLCKSWRTSNSVLLSL